MVSPKIRALRWRKGFCPWCYGTLRYNATSGYPLVKWQCTKCDHLFTDKGKDVVPSDTE